MAIVVVQNNGFTATGDGTPGNPLNIYFEATTSTYSSLKWLRLKATNLGSFPGIWYLSNFNGISTGGSQVVSFYKGPDASGQLIYTNTTNYFNLDTSFNIVNNDELFIVIDTPPSSTTSLSGFSFVNYGEGPPPPPVDPISLYVITQPALNSSGQLLSTQPSIGIQDQYGNPLTSYETDVQASLIVISGSATLTGTTTVSTINGVADFTDLIITGNGLFYIQFDSTILSLNSVNSNQLFFPPDAGNPNPPIPVKPKRSYVAGSVPAYTDLEVNEFAINVADRKGYMRDSNDIVHLLFDGYASGGGGSGGTVYSVGISSTDLDVSNSPITTSGFIGLDLKTQSLTAATYGDASNVAEVTVNDKGIVTGIQNVAISYPVNSITAGTDISLTGTAPDYTINNTAPDQIVSITSGTGISVTGTYPNFTVDNTITQYTDADARLALSAGTGISYDNTTGVITNSEPDQIVGLTGGTDISVTGTYPNFTIDYTGTNTGVTSIIAGTGISVDQATGAVTVTNTDPDQVVSLTAGTGISVTGTYPNFTIDSTITQYTDADARLSLSAGTGISYDNTTGVITNSEPDQVVSLTGGTDISVTGTYPNFTIDNDAPDQIVSLTGGTDIGVTGTYPNFTIDYTGTAGTGTVTSVGITSTAAALTITNSPITTSGDIGVNFAGKGSEYVTGDGSLKTFPTTIDQALNLITEVYNSTGSTLTKGTVVYINGGQGNLPTVTKAQANSDANSAQTYGVVQSDITNNNNGYVVVIGMLSDIDTQSYSAGTQLYLSPTTAGAWTTTKPSAPSHLVYVGIVVYSHPTQGVVEIKIQNGYELDEIHDVSITSVASNNILRYNSSTKLWENVAGTTSSISEGTNLYYTDARARLSLSAGTGISYNNTTGVITNSSPDQTVVLTAGTGISTSGTYPNFTITNSAPDQTVKLTAGTGISTSGTYPNFTITNSSPDQTVILTAGSGISVTGTYPSFTIGSTITQYTDSDARKSISAGTGISYSSTTGIITNSSPDQTVTLTAGTGISVTGTYPSFTIGSTITQYTDTDARKSISAGTGISYDNTTGVITNDAPDQTVSLTAGTDISITGTYPNFTIGYSGTSSGGVTSIIAGTGISVDVSTGDVTVTNTDPDQVVSLTAGTSISITGTYPSFTITNDDPDQVVSLTAGTGISVSGTYPSFTVTNSSPDQTVKITAGTGISVSGTYPNFTVTNSSPSSGGTVTSIATTSPITGGTITGSGTIGINASSTNTASYVVQRDASGNFAAGTITASLTGTASTATNIAGGSGGSIPYQSSAGTTAMLSNGTSGQFLQSNGGTSAPSWSNVIPSGVMQMFGGSITQSVSSGTLTTTAPSGWALCDGSAISRTTYSALFTAIGTTYGAGNGSTTFNIPDLRGRSPIGSGTGSGLTNRVLGTQYGAETVTLDSTSLPIHSHANTVSGGNTGNMSANSTHAHQLQYNAGSGAGGNYGYLDRFGNQPTNIFTNSSSTEHQHAFTPSISNANAGSGGSHANIQPVLAINYIIKI